MLACKAAADAFFLVGIEGWFQQLRCVVPQGQHSFQSGVNKLFTTSWPLQVFVQLVAAWAHKHKWP